MFLQREHALADSVVGRHALVHAARRWLIRLARGLAPADAHRRRPAPCRIVRSAEQFTAAIVPRSYQQRRRRASHTRALRPSQAHRPSFTDQSQCEMLPSISRRHDWFGWPRYRQSLSFFQPAASAGAWAAATAYPAVCCCEPGPTEPRIGIAVSSRPEVGEKDSYRRKFAPGICPGNFRTCGAQIQPRAGRVNCPGNRSVFVKAANRV
eukprot:COSAG06_NODE_229_length_19707_cov_10.537230_5_plen_209_part_00